MKTLLSLLLCAALPLAAATYYVSPNGSDANNGLSPAAAFRTFLHATETLMDGDTLIITEGVYTNPGNRAAAVANVVFGSKTNGAPINNISVLGQGPANTIFRYVDGIGTNVTMTYNIRLAGTGNKLSGLRLDGDILGNDWWQPVISVHLCSNSVVSNIWVKFPNTINGRTAISPLWVVGVDNVLVTRCLVDGGGIGGRVFNWDKFHNMTLLNCTFVNQLAQSADRGMGVVIEGNSGTKVQNCVFANNANYAISCWNPETSLPQATQTVANCLYWQPGQGFLDVRDPSRVVVLESGTVNQDPLFETTAQGLPYSVPVALSQYGWNVVPEPAAMMLLALGAGWLALRRR